MLDIDPKLAQVFDTLSSQPFFCAYKLTRLQQEQGQTPEQQAESLGVRLERLVFLGLCPMPKNRADVEVLAWQLGLEARMLAELLGVV